jgi:hypothetical protein
MCVLALSFSAWRTSVGVYRRAVPTQDERLAALADARRLVEFVRSQIEAETDHVRRADMTAAYLRALQTLVALDKLEDEIKAEAADRLPGQNKARTIPEDMAQTQKAHEPRRRGRPLKTQHPFPRALEAKGSHVAEWADKHKVPRETAKSWHSPPPTGRSIPRHFAKVIERELKIPATLDVWKNGIQD